jgi:hypothetical protein
VRRAGVAAAGAAAGRGGNGASLRFGFAGFRSGRTALLRLRSGQALKRSIRGDGCSWGRVARVGKRIAGSALPLPVARLPRHFISCSHTRTRGSRSDQRLGALSQLSESHSAVDGGRTADRKLLVQRRKLIKMRILLYPREDLGITASGQQHGGPYLRALPKCPVLALPTAFSASH